MNLKILITVIITGLLLGCAQTDSTTTSYYQNSLKDDPLFKDCIAKDVPYVINHIRLDSITVVRCPNSITTTKETSGKDKQTTIVIDGITYERKEK